MFLIKEMPSEERPREKLIMKGVEKLSNVELLAIILRTGSKQKSVIELSKEIVYHLETLSELNQITISELTKIKGLKNAKAATVLAAIELGKRIANEQRKTKKITSSHDVYNLMSDIITNSQETFYCILLDTKLNIIKRELIYIGTIDQMVIHPREIFKSALKNSAASIIVVHNHPSGDATPSFADNQTTKILQEVAEIVKIKLLDHIIVGNKQFYSYKESRIFKI